MAGNSLEIGAFALRYDQGTGEIHLTAATDEARFADENGEHPGLLVVFSSNPRSANYHPRNFNRCSRVLAAAGLPAPAEVPEHRRHLAERDEVIAALVAEGGAEAVSAAEDY